MNICGELEADTGSFRDRNNRVYYAERKVLRGVSEAALKNWSKISGQQFFKKMMENGDLIPTKLLPATDRNALTILKEGWAGVLQHQKIPFISYPYEWTFGMLKDSALLHLDILERSLKSGWILKDATAYNVQWIGTKPTFIDIISFEPYKEGNPWGGYRQFCMMFLIPLLLKAYRDVDYIPLLRSDLEGIDPVQAVKIFPKSSLFRKAVFLHIFLHAKLQMAFYDDKASKQTEPRKAIRHSKAMVLGTIQGLHRIVQRLDLQNKETIWRNYADCHSYDEDSYGQKQAFVRKHLQSTRWKLVWDIGCNTGTFSQICSEFSDYVISIDGDQYAIEALYQKQKQKAKGNILPLIMDLSNLSPNQGWLGQERKDLESRGQPELLLCLALIHHMVISANIPMRDYLGWIRQMNAAVIIEFVGPGDEMTKVLLKNKVNQYTDYTKENFEQIARERFLMVDSCPLKGGDREVYFLKPKS